MVVDQSQYPYLFSEQIWPWGPVKTIFEPTIPPAALVSNINIVPYDQTGWLIIRQEMGWGIVGGTMEPNEHYLTTLKRELREEAGCTLINFKLFGALRMEFLTERPYRQQLPFPISYRLLGVGEVKQVTTPSNPANGEHILEIATYTLDEACKKLAARPDDGPLLADIYRYAAAIGLHD